MATRTASRQATPQPDGESSADRLKSYLLSFVTGVMLFIALALLLYPDLDEVQAAWATFYGDF